MALITVLVSTLNGGINKLSKLITIQDKRVGYLIVHQVTNNDFSIPEFLKRCDIEVLQFKDRGLVKSRNLAIKNCKTKFGLIADDDISYIREGFLKMLNILESEENLDFATFQIRTPEGEPPYKTYPTEEYVIGKNPKHWFTSGEMVLNIETLKAKKIYFDTRFGLGTFLERGEEDVLIYDLVKANCFGMFYPLELFIVPLESSGKRKRSDFKQFFYLGALHQRLQAPLKYNNWKSYFFSPKLILRDFYTNLGASYIKTTKSE